jgi:hypothetical protein
LLIETSSDLIKRCQAVERQEARLILAYGEATGHHHAIADERAPDGAEFVSAEHALELYLLVHEHEEHAALLIEPGAYARAPARVRAGSGTHQVAD